MSRQGERLRRLAARVFSERALTRLVDPIVADMQEECARALHRRGPWAARWMHVVGVVGLIKALAWHMAVDGMRLRDAEERTAVRQALIAGVTTAVIAVGIFWRPQFRPGLSPWLNLYLLPQAAVLMTPIATLFAVLVGYRGAAPSLKLSLGTLVMACMLSGAAFMTFGWLMPWGNQEFRSRTFAALLAEEAMARSAGRAPAWGPDVFAPEPILMRGLPELTLPELANRVRESSTSADQRYLTHVALQYHRGYALPAATLTLVLFAMAVARRRRGTTSRRLAMGFGAIVAYYFAMMLGQSIMRGGDLSPALAAWFPNLMFLVLTGLLVWRGNSSHSEPASPR